MHRSILTITAVALGLVAVGGCKKKEAPAPSEPAATPAKATPLEQAPAKAPAPTIDENLLKAYGPLPDVMDSKDNPVTDAKVELGRMLYYDKRLSKNHDISCNSCHKLDAYGVDGEPTSPGHKKQRGTRNSPTVYNAAGHLAQFWDGREPDVEAQAKGPILNPVEMAMPSNKVVLRVLRSIPAYGEAFKKAFPDDKKPITYDNLGRAIGAFERKLVTPSRWDKFLGGDKSALSDDEKKGFMAFTQTGCPTCHSGVYVGGAMFQKLGLVKPWPSDKDQGRFEATKKDADKMFFKVPSLRNIEKTGPYFHDGSVADLSKAVAMMAEHQLNKTLGADEIASIVTWLKALTGPLPEAYIKEPALPESTKRTPKPNPN